MWQRITTRPTRRVDGLRFLITATLGGIFVLASLVSGTSEPVEPPRPVIVYEFPA